jgi:putative transposase
MISVEKAQGVPVSLACRLLGVSRSGYVKWERRPLPDRALTDAWLLEKLKEIHTENRGVYGAPRVHAELRIRYDIRVGRKRVERAMRQAGLSGLITRKRGRTTIRVPGVRGADDLVGRKFRPDASDVLWIADLTYLRTWEGWLYLAAVQDAFSRRMVGWSMADQMRRELVVDALTMAVSRRRPEPGLIHHSDQGSPIRLPRLRPRLPEGWDRPVDGIARGLLGQRRRRDVLRHPQEAARLPSDVADPSWAGLGSVRVHRGVLQPPAPALHPGPPLTRRVSKSLAALRCETNRWNNIINTDKYALPASAPLSTKAGELHRAGARARRCGGERCELRGSHTSSARPRESDPEEAGRRGVDYRAAGRACRAEYHPQHHLPI